MAIHLVAADVGLKTGTVGFIDRWLKENPDTEIIDIKYHGTEEEDSVLVIYRREE